MLIHNTKISNITNKSNEVTKGSLFAAIRGYSLNGEDFIESAIQNGASAILKYGEVDQFEIVNEILFIMSPNPRQALSKYASKFFQAKPKTITAVTGTNGKTSTVNITRQILQLLNKKSASIGTLGVVVDKYDYQDCLTSPDCITLHKILQNLDSLQIDNVIMEASSHALDQYRLDGVDINYGLWTNFSQDHIDYHQTEQNYFNAKCRLIELSKDTFVYNADDAKISDYIVRKNIKNVISFGFTKSDCQIIEATDSSDSNFRTLLVSMFGKIIKFEIKLFGNFQISNFIGSLVIAHLHGCQFSDIADITQRIDCIPGRFELIKTIKTNKIFLDFAHTPDGLKNVLTSLRELKHNRIITVFGCGGDRDKIKRPIMGKIASEMSDISIITNDNPRNEPPEQIAAQILSNNKISEIILDRKLAIAHGISLLSDNDILLIAGKGHEQFQIIGDVKFKFNDSEVVQQLTSNL